MLEFVSSMLKWIPGCSPSVPETWQGAALQAVTCFIRLVVFLAGAWAIVRFVT